MLKALLNLTATELRAERFWRQRALAAAAIDPKQMHQISAEVREIDQKLRSMGERGW